MPAPSDSDSLYCKCGQAKLASVKSPVPGVHYCVFGACQPEEEPVKGSASAR